MLEVAVVAANRRVGRPRMLVQVEVALVEDVEQPAHQVWVRSADLGLQSEVVEEETTMNNHNDNNNSNHTEEKVRDI